MQLYSHEGRIHDAEVIDRYLEQIRMHPFLPVEDSVMPETGFVISRYGNGYNSFVTKWNYNNAFDPNVISLLEETDTLAIQEAETLYIRQ